MGESDEKKKKRKTEPELQKEFEEIEHTPEEHAKECAKDVDELLKEIEGKEEEHEEEEEHHEEKEEEE